jgi:hydroxymethylpyrimidine pyrophosphatase-like HAD family hydrolase
MGVAMGNALPVAKAAANKVTLHHDHGGIEFMLKELGLV